MSCNVIFTFRKNFYNVFIKLKLTFMLGNIKITSIKVKMLFIGFVAFITHQIEQRLCGLYILTTIKVQPPMIYTASRAKCVRSELFAGYEAVGNICRLQSTKRLTKSCFPYIMEKRSTA